MAITLPILSLQHTEVPVLAYLEENAVKCCELKQRFLHVWHGTDQTIIENAIDEWRGRLCACMRAAI